MTSLIGSVNGLPAKFSYHPPTSTPPPGQRPIDDQEAGLEIVVRDRNHLANDENQEEKIRIPYSEIIALIPDKAFSDHSAENARQTYTLFHSAHLLPEEITSAFPPIFRPLIHPDDPSQQSQLTLENPPPSLLARFSLPNSTLPDHLDARKYTITIIISTAAGIQGHSEQVYTTCLKPILSRLNIHETSHFRVLRTTGAHSITEYISSLQPSAHLIVLLSGDTSITELINSLPSTLSEPSLILCLIPTGTANALSTSTNTTSSPLSTLLLGNPKTLPLLRITFSQNCTPINTSILPKYATTVLSWAFHSSLVADSDTEYYRKTYPGIQRFKVAARENLLPSPHVYHGKISILPASSSSFIPLQQSNSREEKGGRESYTYLLSLLPTHLEKNFPINPLGKPLGGNIHIIYIPGAVSTTKLHEIMEMVYAGGKHIEDPSVRYLSEGTRGIRIEVLEDDYVPGSEEEKGKYTTGRWRRVCVDGLIVEVGKGGWVEGRIVDEEEKVRVLYRK